MLNIIEVTDSIREKIQGFKEELLDPTQRLSEACQNDDERLDLFEFQHCECYKKLFKMKFYHEGALRDSNDSLWVECVQMTPLAYVRANAEDTGFDWNFNFQQVYITDWAEGQAIRWMIDWTGQQMSSICNSRIDQQQSSSDINITSHQEPASALLNDNIFNPPMALGDVRKWFIQLAENNSGNGMPFLTVEQVNQFIDRAFIGNSEQQKLTFNMIKGERTSITKLFYEFYDYCTEDYAIEPTKHCKDRYVRLLTDNFNGYNYQTVFKTFNNSMRAPKKWETTI